METPASGGTPSSDNGAQSFENAVETAILEQAAPQSSPTSVPCEFDAPLSTSPFFSSLESLKTPPSLPNAAAAYQKNAGPEGAEPVPISDFQKYKDDQLLRNPGGRNYYLDEKKVVENPSDLSAGELVRKDLSDVAGNIGKFFGNMLMGTKILYRDDQNRIQTGRQRGILGVMLDFCKDLGSALSFGTWRPDSTPAPSGLKNRFLYSVSKLKDAFAGDILTGIPSSANHMGKNLALAGWHLMEVLPDTVTGSFSPGQKVTSKIFDNGHVVIEYLTDIVPSGDAWLRVHASNLGELKPPILYNIKMPEHYNGDMRWQYVRNTPFRKTIETIGALLMDALAIGLIGQTGSSSNRRNRID